MTTDAEFLTWIHDRLVLVHQEHRNYDYMHRLREIIRRVAATPDLVTACKYLVAAVKEPTLQSMGFAQPPEYATAEDDELAHAISDARTAIAKATG